MKNIKLKDGRDITLREATKADAAAMLKYVDTISVESDNLTFGRGEFTMSVEEEERFIERTGQTDNALFLIAVVNDEIVGNLSFSGGMRKRIRHVGEFGVSVRKDYWGLGLGRALIEYLVNWAQKGGIVRKINLRVRTVNENAINLYKSLGFEIEGMTTREFMINGEFFDSYHMGLKLD